MDAIISPRDATLTGEWVRYATKKRTAHFFLDNDADAINAPALCGAHRGAHGEADEWEVERIANTEGAYVANVCRACQRYFDAELESGIRRMFRAESTPDRDY